MKCHDVREALSAHRASGTTLTERALVEAHLRQCVECLQAEARLQQAAVARGVVPRALLDSLALHRALLTVAITVTGRVSAAVMRATGRGIGHFAYVGRRLRALLTGAVTLTGRASVSVMWATGHGIGQFVAWIVRLRGLLVIRFRSCMRAVSIVTEAIIGCAERSALLLRSFPASLLGPSVRGVGVVLGLAFVLHGLQWTGARQHVQSAPPSGPGLERTQVVSFPPLPPVIPSVEATSAAPTTPWIDEPRQSLPRSVASLPQRASTRGAARESPGPTPPVAHRGALVTHVVGRLAARERAVSEGEFTALLARVGGTELDRQPGVTSTTIEVAVPQDRYDDFTRGLTRLGTWQLEAARSPLPDPVHMTILLVSK